MPGCEEIALLEEARRRASTPSNLALLMVRVITSQQQGYEAYKVYCEELVRVRGEYKVAVLNSCSKDYLRVLSSQLHTLRKNAPRLNQRLMSEIYHTAYRQRERRFKIVFCRVEQGERVYEIHRS